MDHLKKFKSEVIPLMSTFKEKFKVMTADNEKMNNCIAIFDETMCEKASKTSLYDLEKTIGDEYVSKH